MKKTEFLTNVKENLAGKELTVSKKDLAMILEAVSEETVKAVEAREDVKPLDFLTIKVVEKPRREGVSKLGEEKPWVVEAHEEPKAVLAKSFRKMLMQ